MRRVLVNKIGAAQGELSQVRTPALGGQKPRLGWLDVVL